MIGCFTAGMVYDLRGGLKSVNFVVTNTKKNLKCVYYLWKLLLNTKL